MHPEPSPTCRHTPIAPNRGMQMVARDEDTVLFRCSACSAEYRAFRCVALKTKRDPGRRCNGAARLGHLTCRAHANDELVNLFENLVRAAR